MITVIRSADGGRTYSLGESTVEAARQASRAVTAATNAVSEANRAEFAAAALEDQLGDSLPQPATAGTADTQPDLFLDSYFCPASPRFTGLLQSVSIRSVGATKVTFFLFDADNAATSLGQFDLVDGLNTIDLPAQQCVDCSIGYRYDFPGSPNGLEYTSGVSAGYFYFVGPSYTADGDIVALSPNVHKFAFAVNYTNQGASIDARIKRTEGILTRDNGTYTMRGVPTDLGYDLEITRSAYGSQPDAQGLAPVPGHVTAIASARAPNLDALDRVTWIDQDGVELWQPAAGLPSSETSALDDWSEPKRVIAGNRIWWTGDSLSTNFNGTTGGSPADLVTDNDSVSGSTSTEIMARLGFTAPTITVTGNSIPGDGSYVNLAAFAPNLILFNTPGGTMPGFIAGVPVYLKQDGGTGVFSVARRAAGAAVPVTAGSKFVRDLDGLDDRILWLWMGRNDIENSQVSDAPQTIIDRVIDNYKLVFDTYNGLYKQFLFVPPPQATTDTQNKKDMVTGLRQALKDEFGDYLATGYGYCLDLTAMAFDTGPDGLLQRAGYTPDSNDAADIAAGLWPRQLRTDGGVADFVHQNVATSNAIRTYVLEELLPERGWFT